MEIVAPLFPHPPFCKAFVGLFASLLLNMARMNLAVDAGIAQDLTDEARRQNKTLYAIANEAIQAYLRISRMDKTPEDIYRILQGFEFLKAISAVPIPETLLDRILQVAFRNSREEVLRAWYEEGRVFGELLKSHTAGLDGLSQYVKRFKELLPISMVDVNIDDERVELIMTGTGYSLESATCTAEGVKGFLEAFGLKVEKVEAAGGFVKVEATRSK